MSNLEVAFEVKDRARFIVGSEDIEPGAGWPYTPILKELATRPGFRLLPPDNGISVLLAELADQRQKLVARKITLGNRKGALEEQRIAAQAESDRLKKATVPEQTQIDAKSAELAQLPLLWTSA